MSELFNIPRRVKRGWMNLRVDRIVDDTHDTKTFFLVDADEGGRPFDIIAGQYLTFRFDSIAEKPIVRSYTMSSSPLEMDHTAFTVKRVEGGMISNWLCDNIKVGSILRGRGPIGRFCYDPTHDHKHLFMVAAGSGVTPFLSIVREFQDRLGQPNSPELMSLLVSYRTQNDIIGADLFKAVRNKPGINIYLTLSREDQTSCGFMHGRIDRRMLERLLPIQVDQATYMLCGPVDMMNLTKALLVEQGLAEDHVKTEAFDS